MTRRTADEFERILAQMDVPRAGRELVHRIRSSDPARRVNGSSTVSGRFPSRKMACTVQYESRSEGAAIALYEADPSVEEFYDQPHTFRIERVQLGSVRRPSVTPLTSWSFGARAQDKKSSSRSGTPAPA